MSGKPKDIPQAAYGPLRRRTFKAAPLAELQEDLPSLGELTARAIAVRLEELVERCFPKTERLRMGQILWPAVDEGETGGYGESIEHTRLKPVLLEAVGQQDIEDFLEGVARKTIRQNVTLRLCRQAKEQGGVLHSVDAASLVRLSPGMVCRYVREYEKRRGEVVPPGGGVFEGRDVDQADRLRDGDVGAPGRGIREPDSAARRSALRLRSCAGRQLPGGRYRRSPGTHPCPARVPTQGP